MKLKYQTIQCWMAEQETNSLKKKAMKKKLNQLGLTC